MCGRYTLYQTQDLNSRFNLSHQPAIRVADNYNVTPGQTMPVLRLSNGNNFLDLMRWGFIPSWSKDIKMGYRLINARAETLFKKPIWSQAILNCRCLIPATGFYEWQAVGDNKLKKPFYIHPKNQKLFTFAGIWNLSKDAEGLELKTFSIITVDANKEMAAIHERMPVILKPSEEARWLRSSLGKTDIMSILKPYEDNKLDIYEVSSDVNNPRNNSERLVQKL